MSHESQGAWRSAQGWVVGFRTWCIPWEGRAGTTLPAPLPLRCPLSLPTRFSPARALQSHPGDVRSCWLPQEALSRALTSGSLLPLPFLLSGSQGGHAAAWKRAGASLAQVPGGPLRRNLTPSGGPPSLDIWRGDTHGPSAPRRAARSGYCVGQPVSMPVLCQARDLHQGTSPSQQRKEVRPCIRPAEKGA